MRCMKEIYMKAPSTKISINGKKIGQSLMLDNNKIIFNVILMRNCESWSFTANTQNKNRKRKKYDESI